MLLSYRFRLYPSKTTQARLSEHLELCRWLYNRLLSVLDASWGSLLQMLAYKAERAARRVMKANPRGTSEGLTQEDPYRDYISAYRILQSWLGRPPEPAERRPLLQVTAHTVITGQATFMKQEAPSFSWG